MRPDQDLHDMCWNPSRSCKPPCILHALDYSSGITSACITLVFILKSLMVAYEYQPLILIPFSSVMILNKEMLPSISLTIMFTVAFLLEIDCDVLCKYPNDVQEWKKYSPFR